MNKNDLKLDWASHKAAKYACEHWHYSKSMPSCKMIKIGVWENKIYIGVIIFSRGANNNLLKPFGLNQNEGCELTRVALRNHHSTISKMISISIKMLKMKAPGIKLIISFADPNEGHHGGIYQASNWIYNGKSKESCKYIKNGKYFHKRTISAKYKTEKMNFLKQKGYEKKYIPGKHRYLMPLTKEMREKILPLAKPYPKACEVCDGSDQEHSGGETPTRTLQT